MTLSGISKDDLLAINEWIKEATNGQIPTFLQQLPASTVMLLLNAIHFHGELHRLYFSRGRVRDQAMASPFLTSCYSICSFLYICCSSCLAFLTVMVPNCLLRAKIVTGQAEMECSRRNLQQVLLPPGSGSSHTVAHLCSS